MNFGSAPAASDLIDFLLLPDTYAFDTAGYERRLRRHDLATLRQLARRESEGVEDGNLIDKTSRNRLVAHGLAKRDFAVQEDGRAAVLNFATTLGHRTVRANVSCIDGSEGYRRP